MYNSLNVVGQTVAYFLIPIPTWFSACDYLGGAIAYNEIHTQNIQFSIELPQTHNFKV